MKLLKSASVAPRPHPRGGARGFTLVEILVVITMIGILLVVTFSALGGGSGPKARKGAREEIVALLTRARAEAIAQGKPVAVVIVGTQSGPDALRGKSLALFEARRNEQSGNWEAREQLQRWIHLPSTAVLLDGSVAPPVQSQGNNVLDQVGGLTVEVIDKQLGQKVSLVAPCIIFESTGAVSYPSEPGRVEFYIGEGNWYRSKFTLLAKRRNGEAVADRVVVSRLGGRAHEVAAEKN